jgi:hypothetical protein
MYTVVTPLLFPPRWESWETEKITKPSANFPHPHPTLLWNIFALKSLMKYRVRSAFEMYPNWLWGSIGLAYNLSGAEGTGFDLFFEIILASILLIPLCCSEVWDWEWLKVYLERWVLGSTPLWDHPSCCMRVPLLHILVCCSKVMNWRLAQSLSLL